MLLLFLMLAVHAIYFHAYGLHVNVIFSPTSCQYTLEEKPTAVHSQTRYGQLDVSVRVGLCRSDGQVTNGNSLADTWHKKSHIGNVEA